MHEAFRDLQAENQRLKEAIESEWERAGLPTFLRYLKDYIKNRSATGPAKSFGDAVRLRLERRGPNACAPSLASHPLFNLTPVLCGHRQSGRVQLSNVRDFATAIGTAIRVIRSI